MQAGSRLKVSWPQSLPVPSPVIANRELMPLRLNIQKKDTMGARQLDMLPRL